MIRLVAVDIDGTITSADRKLNLAAVGAIRELEEKGVEVTISTGNILQYAEAASTMIGTSGPIIAEDGGIVYDKRNKIEYVLGDRADVDRALTVLTREIPGVKETRNSQLRLTGATIERGVDIDEIRKVLKKNHFKLVAVDSGVAIHLKNPSVNKGNAIRKVAEITGAKLSEIAAIGDGLNDVEMLEVAGVSFAVSNSPQEVKRVATYTTSGPDGAGMVEAARRILEMNEKTI
ncbi:MAG: phosphoglycolate phosphatase [Candidatus Hadarchaeales archaeon]